MSGNKAVYARAAAIVAAVVTALTACFVTFTAAKAATPVYYVCYESDDYRVRAVNKMDEANGVYTLSPTLSQGAKFLVSDGEGALFGNAKGEPVTVTESGARRYTVTFDPSATPAVSYADYSPEAVEIKVTGDAERTEAMIYRAVNAAFDEYVATVYGLEKDDAVTVVCSGVEYGVNGMGEVGYTVPLDGDYRFTFTKDADNLYDGKYIFGEDVPELYVLCEANGYEAADEYKLTRNEDVAIVEYEYVGISVAEKDGKVKYSVYDATAGETYKPSESGEIEIHDKGEYRVRYTPNVPLRTDGEKSYYTALARVEDYYDGYFVLGDFNDYEFVDDEDFAQSYELIKDDGVTDYDEYKLTLYITDEMLDATDGAVEFYITDGTHIYRRPASDRDIRIERAGEYELYFSPTHNYGRGYNYRYDRVADDITRETVYISTADELIDFLAKCVSPEFSLNKSVIVTRDVDLSGKAIVPAATFAGELDGLFNTVRGVNISTDVGAYLFGTVTADGKITRLNAEVDLSGGDYAALVRYNYGRLEKVSVSGAVSGDGFVGGIVAANYAGGEIVECESSVKVSGKLNVGGIVGFNAGEVELCRNAGAVNNEIFPSSDARGMLNVGGVAGYSTGNIFGCENAGNVGVDQARYFGGIVGLCSGGLYFCENVGTVGAENYAGGIVGYYGRFDSNGNNPSVSGQLTDEIQAWLDSYFGSGDGNFEEEADNGVREIYYCVNGGSVTAEQYAGGIAGNAGAGGLDVIGCASDGNITAKTAFAGGIAGILGASNVSECATVGDVIAQKGGYAGGIAGQSTGTVRYCATACYVKGETSYIGGIVGDGATVENCVAHAFVDGGDERFGAIAGAASVYANNFYAKNAASAAKGIDGVIYGSENGYGAHELDEGDILSVGMLSAELYGLSAEHWLAGESEPRYPVPRAFTDIVKPEQYGDSAKFESAFAATGGVAQSVKAVGEGVGLRCVTVVFYEWNFGSDKYERLQGYYIAKGDGLTAPEVPQEDGYFTWWDTTDFSRFDEDTAVYMQYDKYKTSLASDDTNKPLVIVTGRFYSDTTLEIEYNGEYMSVKLMRGGVRVEQPDDTIRVRYFLNGAKRPTVKLISGGEITEPSFDIDGGYAIFDLPRGSQFCVTERSAGDNLGLILGLSIPLSVLVTALAFAIPMIVIRVRKKRIKNEE